MAEGISSQPPGRGRPFAKGRSGNPTGRRYGCRNKKTLAAAALLEGEAEALTRKAVELALAGEPGALRLCLERLLPPCRERAVAFALPPIESAADIAAAMKAVTAALAAARITPGEAVACVASSTPLCGRSKPRISSGVWPPWKLRRIPARMRDPGGVGGYST